jgi:esterase/lipase
LEFAQILTFLAAQAPEFVIGFCLGMLVAILIAYVYLLPRFVKNATAALTKQVELLASQVLTQTTHITHLEAQIHKLESELGPYRQFAEQQLAKLLIVDTNENPV